MIKKFTSESVTEGHPDKLCDLISDSILDAYLAEDKKSRVACETMASKGEIIITGEITSNAKVDIDKVVRNTIKNVGYDSEDKGLDYKTCKIHINLSEQSKDIALGVDKCLESKEGNNEEQEGAGDQGIMFGYACNETDNLMPMPIYYAHALAKQLTKIRKDNTLSYLRPDGKTQVTVEYDNDKPIRIDTIVVSAQHDKNIELEALQKDIKEYVIKPIIPSQLMDKNTKIYINPTGRFELGGPQADSGLTGRKIIVDTYGGYARHGGGAFSGKDSTKVDRSASYMARYVAKNIVANKLADKCEIQLSYAIGVAKPLSIYVNTYSTGKKTDEEIIKIIEENFDLTPRGIINYLHLENPIYKSTTNYGHFGKENLPWEKIIKL